MNQHPITTTIYDLSNKVNHIYIIKMHSVELIKLTAEELKSIHEVLRPATEELVRWL